MLFVAGRLFQGLWRDFLLNFQWALVLDDFTLSFYDVPLAGAREIAFTLLLENQTISLSSPRLPTVVLRNGIVGFAYAGEETIVTCSGDKVRITGG